MTVYVKANTRYIENKTHLYFNKRNSVKKQWIFFLRMSHVQQNVLCSTRYTAQCAHRACTHFHTHANLCVRYKKQRNSVCCCPYLQNSLSDGNGTVQNVTAVQTNTITIRHDFLFYLRKSIWVSTPINQIILCKVHIYNVGRVAQSVWRLVTGWTVRGSKPGGGELFRTRPYWPWGPPSLLCNGYRVFPGGKATGAWFWPAIPS
jgi:hypothetical protein